MKRGTLMVLKRLFVTALSALGVGALATGPALGQGADSGNIPAPDLFNDQITCINNLPPTTGMGAAPRPTRPPRATDANPNPLSDLDIAIGMGTDTIGDMMAIYDAVTFIVPPEYANCGQRDPADGMVITTEFNPDSVAMGGDGSIAYDVAQGYTEVLEAFMDVYGDGGTAGELEDALKAFNDADADDSDYDDLEEDVRDLRMADDMARSALAAISEGPVYQAAIAEWMAKGVVEKAVEDYDDAVDVANGGRTALRGLTYDMYTELDNLSLAGANNDGVGAVVTAHDNPATRDIDESNVSLAALRTYANADGATVGMTNPDGTTTTDDSNFDDTGKLLIPMVLVDHDNDAATPEVLRRVFEPDTTEVGTIMDRVTAVNRALDTLRKKAAENENDLLQPLFDEAVERAEAEAEFYNDQLTDMLANRDNKNATAEDARPEEDDENTFLDETSDYSIYSVNREYQAALNKRVAEEEDLRAAARARETATSNVLNAFTSPADFYQQLVDRREALKAAADSDVAEAVADGRTVSEDLTDAVEAADESLQDARDVLADYQELVGDDEDDPARALIDELLKGNGDDGAALVEAISSTYDVAAGAAEEAQEAVDDALSGLTGEGGAIDMNTQRSIDNTNSIVELEGEVWDADNNSRIDANETRGIANETRSIENRTMIGENRDMIATNTGLITGLRTDVDSNMGRITQNEDDILHNAGNIMLNDGRITANRTDIDQNTMGIASNMNSIGQNTGLINDNRTAIGELNDDLDVVRAGVAASMALAGMPAINGRGISIGVGSFDGESAFAVGFQIQGEMASFKVGVTSASGATGASAGVGFQF